MSRRFLDRAFRRSPEMEYPSTLSLTQRQWHPRCTDELDPDCLRALCKTLQVSLLTARVLASRGMGDVESAHAFLNSPLSELPDPWLLPGIKAAVSRLSEALKRQEPIAVHGDYDVDGISASALMVETLRALGGRVDYHIPLRLRDGYGLSPDAIRKAAGSGAKIVVSVDCGITAVAEALLARNLGLDLIITDHHQPPSSLPQALALINPLLPDSRFPSKDLAGIGVAFFLLGALRQRLREEGYFKNRVEPDLRRSLDLVALGTIADVVPLRGVNRSLVRAGLKIMSAGKRPGLEALKRVAGVDRVSCASVGFGLAPRLNAAGRLEDAALGVELLLTSDFSAALPIARELDGFNKQRRSVETETLEKALQNLRSEDVEGRHSLVLADSEWHPGVIGIVASRLVEKFHRPTLMIALENGVGKGSGRSIPGFHLYRGLAECGEFLEGFGGHGMAAGITIAEHQIPAFADAFEKTAAASIRPEDLVAKRWFDDEILLEETTTGNVRELDSLRPCGTGNPEPVFLAKKVRALRPAIVGGKHLKFTASRGGYSQPCIAFGLASLISRIPSEIDLLVTPVINSWKGRENVQLLVKDIRSASPNEV